MSGEMFSKDTFSWREREREHMLTFFITMIHQREEERDRERDLVSVGSHDDP